MQLPNADLVQFRNISKTKQNKKKHKAGKIQETDTNIIWNLKAGTKSHKTQAQCLTAWEQGKLGWPSGRAEAGQ